MKLPKKLHRNNNPKTNRAKEVLMDETSVGNFGVSVETIDKEILWHLNNVVRLNLERDNKSIPVPIQFTTPELTNILNSDSYDINKRLILPIGVLNRTGIDYRQDLMRNEVTKTGENKLLVRRRYTSKNSYSVNSTLRNLPVTDEYYEVNLPRYVSLTYSLQIVTDYQTDASRIITQLLEFNGTAFGEINKFPVRIQPPQTEYIDDTSGESRYIRTTFDIVVYSYLITDTRDEPAVKKVIPPNKLSITFDTTNERIIPIQSGNGSGSIQVIKSNNIQRGPRGYSTYELAVQQGYTGSLQTWLSEISDNTYLQNGNILVTTVTGSANILNIFSGSSLLLQLNNSGSLTVSNVIGTASFAVTASYALNANFDTGSYVTTSSFNNFTSSYNTGSFTGSFIGDGSQLTGIISSKWSGSGTITRESDVEITGSLRVTGSTNINGNLITNLTSGSIPFIGSSGLLTQDNSNLFWDNTNKRLGIRKSNPLSTLHLVGDLATNTGIIIEHPEVNPSKFGATAIYITGNGQTTAGANNAEFAFTVSGPGSTNISQGPSFTARGNTFVRNVNERGLITMVSGNVSTPIGLDGCVQIGAGSGRIILSTTASLTARLTIFNNGNVAINTTTDAGFRLDVNGTARVQGQITNVAPAIIGRETLYRGSVSDAANDAFFIANGTSNENVFASLFAGFNQSSNTLWSLGFFGQCLSTNDTSDSSNFGLIRFNVARTDNVTDPLNGGFTNIQHRKLYTFEHNAVSLLTIYTNRLQIREGVNIQLATTTGTRIGTATNQLISFWNATPIAQPANTTPINEVLVNTGLMQSGSTITNISNNLVVSGSLTLNINFSELHTNIVSNTISGSNVIHSIHTSSYTSAKYDYVIMSGSNMRAGTIKVAFLSGSVVYNETTTPDIGNTSNVEFDVDINLGNLRLIVNTNENWNIKTSIHLL